MKLDKTSLVKCEICGMEMKWIQNTHLRKHNITLEQYREMFPNSPNKSEDMQKVIQKTRWGSYKPPTKKCARAGCNNRVHYSKKYCSTVCNGKDNTVKHLGKCATSEGNPRFIDGEYAYCKSQKQLAYERDEGKCAKCGKILKDSKYGVHHLVPRKLFKDKKFADCLDNLVTLCSQHHRQIESQFTGDLFDLYTQQKYLNISSLIQYMREKHL